MHFSSYVVGKTKFFFKMTAQFLSVYTDMKLDTSRTRNLCYFVCIYFRLIVKRRRMVGKFIVGSLNAKNKNFEQKPEFKVSER